MSWLVPYPMSNPYPTIYVAEIDLKLSNTIKSDLEEQGFIFSTPAHTVF